MHLVGHCLLAVLLSTLFVSVSAYAQSLKVVHSFCVSTTRSFGEQVRIGSFFAARDGRVFLCVAEIPVSNTQRLKIDSVTCRPWRSAMAAAADVSTGIFYQKGEPDSPLCRLGYSFQADLKSNQARACLMELPDEICMSTALQGAKP